MSPKKKKLTVAVIDTETTMRNEHSHLIFDFAFVIGNVYDDNSVDCLEKNYLIKDTLKNPENFIFTYTDNETGNRVPYSLDSRYSKSLDRWANGERYEVATWDYAYKQFWDYCSRMGVDVITAYNLNFDLKAMQKTQAQFSDKQLRLPNGVDKVCLMGGKTMDKKLSNKAKANLKILRLAIARGDSVKQTFKKLNVDVPIESNISFMVRDGKFISMPMQLDLFKGVDNG